jgi:hypothetical protein
VEVLCALERAISFSKKDAKFWTGQRVAGIAASVVALQADRGKCRAGEGKTDLLWSLMQECLPEDKETIQREIVRHVEYTLACTRLSFEKKHAFQVQDDAPVCCVHAQVRVLRVVCGSALSTSASVQATAHSLRDRMVERANDTEQDQPCL